MHGGFGLKGLRLRSRGLSYASAFSDKGYMIKLKMHMGLGFFTILGLGLQGLGFSCSRLGIILGAIAPSLQKKGRGAINPKAVNHRKTLTR